VKRVLLATLFCLLVMSASALAASPGDTVGDWSLIDTKFEKGMVISLDKFFVEHPLKAGDATRGDVRRLHEAALTVNGRGGCAHPDGAVSLLETALEVFDDDLRKHLKGRHCGRGVRGWFPSGHAVARVSAVASIASSFPVYPVRQR